MSEIESISIKQCPICGKEFSVLYPDMYRYKRTDRNQLKYFCSWSCLREFDKQKGEKIMTVLSDDQRAEAVRIALTGKSPMPFLKECGIKNPSQCFKIIKKNLKESDPETWAKIPGTFKNYNYKPKPMKVKRIETPEGEFAKAPTVKLDGPLRIETPEAKKVEVVETPELKMGPIPKPIKNIDVPKLKPGLRGLNSSDFEVSAIKHPRLGEFYYDQKFNMIDWRTPEGEEVSMSPKAWKELFLLIPDVMGILKVVDDDE